MKKVISIIVIIGLILISLVILYNTPVSREIYDDTWVSSGIITDFNKRFEVFSENLNYDEMKRFLEECKSNCEYHKDEPAFVPIIRYISEDEVIGLMYEFGSNFEDTEYYTGLEKLIGNLKEDKTYSIEFSYIDVREDRPQCLRKINIIEK